MQSTIYLKRMGMIADVLIVLSTKKVLKNINFWPIWTRPKKRLVCEHDQEVGYGTHLFQVYRGLHSLWNIFVWKMCYSDIMARMFGRPFPPDLELQFILNLTFLKPQDDCD